MNAFSRRQAITLGAGALTLAAAGCSSSTTGGTGQASQSAPPKDVTLTIADNSISGGKNAASADFLTSYTIPKFTDLMKGKGITATVKFQPSGVDDEQYKSKIALDLKAKSGADVMNLDGIWVGEFAQAGYIKPLGDVVGDSYKSWDGWAQIPEAVQANASFDGKVYGIPAGTDGRVLYYNKKLFAQAGLPDQWQPTSWQEILDAGTKLKGAGVATPIQINAGTAMGEATTMQGILPLLAGTGAPIYAGGKWQGNTSQIRDVLGFYKSLIDQGLMDKNTQLAAKGRDDSFANFAAGKIAILLEGDYFWRSVINPNKGSAPMATRDADVGYTLIPAKTKGSGLKGQDFVSMSGGGGTFLNPNTKFPQQAWELLQFMASKDTVAASLQGAARITARQDVNATALASDKMLTFVAQKVLPITAYRPGLAVYPQVSQALQQATADIVSGKSVADAANAYQAAVEKVAGGASNVTNN